ncbi:MAG: ribose 5-phosphate isomerase B [Candidatus Theseobacter exili]|nr:ribose 5-phosphate isomerase B [Candidatus Theseobacter exili]
MKIVIGSDHGGYVLKSAILEELRKKGIKCLDVGCSSEDSVDYPDFGIKVGEFVAENEYERGIAICKTGIGMSIVANKVPGIRAALCRDVETAELSRKHNNSNVLVLPASQLDAKVAFEIVNKWLVTDFDKGRHELRVNKISQYETKIQERISENIN